MTEAISPLPEHRDRSALKELVREQIAARKREMKEKEIREREEKTREEERQKNIQKMEKDHRLKEQKKFLALKVVMDAKKAVDLEEKAIRDEKEKLERAKMLEEFRKKW